jgi:hypothetical protein
MLYARETKVCRAEPSNVQNDPQRLESVFHEALSKTSPQERSDYLDDVCRESPELRDEVESLLAAHAQPDGSPALPLNGAFAPPLRSLLNTLGVDSKASSNIHTSSKL